MDPVHTLIDRELVLSGIVHELRGPITAVQGFVELDENNPRPGLEAAVERLARLVGTLSDPWVDGTVDAVFREVPFRARGPVEVLEAALAGLPHGAVTVEVKADHVSVLVEGVPATEQAAGWSLAQVQRWLATGGPGLAGARLRIAARIVGALRYSFPVASGEAEGTVSIHLARG